jgi:hypothetical protein
MSPDGLVLPVAGTLLAKTGVGSPVTDRDTFLGAEPSSSATALDKGLSRLVCRSSSVGCQVNPARLVFKVVMVARNRSSAPAKQEDCGPLGRQRPGTDGQPSPERVTCLWQKGMAERGVLGEISRRISGLRAAGRQVSMAEDVPCR